MTSNKKKMRKINDKIIENQNYPKWKQNKERKQERKNNRENVKGKKE